jgi:hypothetical protein
MAPLLDKAEKYGPTYVALIDRGYLASPRVQQLLKAGKDVQCKPWPSRNQGCFTKEDFTIDLQRGRLTRPAGATANISAESFLAHFSSRTCDPCQLRTNCTVAQRGRGRSVAIHPQEELLMELRRRRRTSEGRAAVRERVHVDASPGPPPSRGLAPTTRASEGTPSTSGAARPSSTSKPSPVRPDLNNWPLDAYLFASPGKDFGTFGPTIPLVQSTPSRDRRERKRL